MNAFVNYCDPHRWKFESIESAIISVTVGRQSQLPINLDSIVQEIGVTIKYTHCSDGFTHFRPGGPIIHLSTAVSSARGRFIVAHELAHILLRNPEAIHLIEYRGQAEMLDNEEDLANRIAGALLVPDNWVEDIKRERLSVARLWEVANRAGIPLSMLIRRMESAGVDIALMHWRHGKRSWQVIDRPGMPFSLHGHVEISALGRRTLDYLGREESEVVIDCRINGRWARIKGRGLRFGSRGEHVFQFLAPQEDIIL